MSKKLKKHGYAERLKYMHMLENGYSREYIHRHYGISSALLGYLWSRYTLGAVTYTLISVMSDLWHTEQDFADHCAIEDDILRPALSNAQENQPSQVTKQEVEALSERELDVLIQVVKGLSNKEIADVLCISTHTVITHRKNITRKLNIHSTAGLTIYAIVNKLINLDALE